MKKLRFTLSPGAQMDFEKDAPLRLVVVDKGDQTYLWVGSENPGSGYCFGVLPEGMFRRFVKAAAKRIAKP